MSDVRSRYAKVFRRGEGTDRIQAFSDGVFAIALTLLVLDLRLPETPVGRLWSALGALWPQYFAFALSFAIIAINWITHHRKFRAIVRFDDRLVWLNFLVLFLVAVVPFPTSVLSDYGDATPAVVLYAATVAALSLAQLLVWVHAYRAGLVLETVDAAVFRYVVINIVPAPVVFLISIPIAFAAPDVAMYSWFAIVPATAVAAAISRRSRDSASAAAS